MARTGFSIILPTRILSILRRRFAAVFKGRTDRDRFREIGRRRGCAETVYIWSRGFLKSTERGRKGHATGGGDGRIVRVGGRVVSRI